MKKWLVAVTIFMLTLALVACGSNDDKEETTPKEPEEVEVTDEERVPDDEVILEIDGEEIKGTTYNHLYKNNKIIQTANGTLDNLDDVKQDTIDQIIYQTMLTQDAANKGIEVTDEEFDEEYNFIKEENSEGLELLLEQFQMTEEAFKDELRHNILYEKYIEAEFDDVEVSDEEVEEVYDELTEESENIPPLDEIRENLELQLRDKQIQELVTKRIDALIEEATIEEYM
ncbi:MAG TPA: SurA N-terminal domain-containing protein [Bacillota bacterium]|nr:SurA N-terminal domain-containing protein [Bacillota bacterium]